MMNWLMKEESGQGMVEYGLILALISVACITVMGTMSNELKTMFGKATNALKTP